MNTSLFTDTKIIKIDNVEFSIGYIPGRIWNRTYGNWGRAMLSFTKLPENITKEKFLNLSDSDRTKLILDKMDPDVIQKANDDLFLSHWDMVKYGVKNHKGLLDNKGVEVPFVKDDGGILSDSTLELYRIRGYFTRLASEVRTFNTVPETEQKN